MAYESQTPDEGVWLPDDEDMTLSFHDEWGMPPGVDSYAHHGLLNETPAYDNYAATPDEHTVTLHRAVLEQLIEGDLTAESADRLFSRLGRYPHTPEDAQRIEDLDYTQALTWLGDKHNPSALERHFPFPNFEEAVGKERLLRHAGGVAYLQLNNFSRNFSAIVTGEAAAQTLSEYTQKDVGKALIHCEPVQRSLSSGAFRTREYVFTHVDDKIHPTPTRRQDDGQNILLTGRTPEGDKVFIKPTLKDRYRYIQADTGPILKKEHIRALKPVDPLYFKTVHALLQDRQSLLRNVATEAGITPSAVESLEMLALQGEAPNGLSHAVDAQISEFIHTNSFSEQLGADLTNNTLSIANLVRQRRVINPHTQKVENISFVIVANRTLRYYATLRQATE